MNDECLSAIEQAAAERSLPVNLMLALATCESGSPPVINGNNVSFPEPPPTLDPDKVNPQSGATGMLQIMPQVALAIVRQNPVFWQSILKIPLVNAKFSAQILENCIQEAKNCSFTGDQIPAGAIACYNAGTETFRQAWERFKDAKNSQPTNVAQLDPYLEPETCQYLERVLAVLGIITEIG